MNAGASAARGEVLLFLHADIRCAYRFFYGTGGLRGMAGSRASRGTAEACTGPMPAAKKSRPYRAFLRYALAVPGR
jgi:hypothetical protein